MPIAKWKKEELNKNCECCGNIIKNYMHGKYCKNCRKHLQKLRNKYNLRIYKLRKQLEVNKE